jgi:hypothetical protein
MFSLLCYLFRVLLRFLSFAFFLSSAFIFIFDFAPDITLNPALDGGVSVSRRIDRHGKSLSDLILNVYVDLPPILTANL